MKFSQKRVWDFMRAFKDALVKEFPDEIDFIIVYGSAVRGEFVPGKSDVDITIQVFKSQDKVALEKRANDLFWKTAQSFPELEFEKAVKKPKGGERAAVDFLYVPIFVFAEGEIDWKNGNLHSEDLLVNLGKNLLVPERSVFLKFKKEGKVIYGRDIRKEIDVQLSILDRVRVNFTPTLLAFAAVLIGLIKPNFAQGLSTKALLYELDGLLTTLDEYEQMSRDEKIKKAELVLIHEFTDKLSKLLNFQLNSKKGSLKSSDFELFSKAFKVKSGELQLSTLQKCAYIFQAFSLILRSNVRALLVLLIR